MTTLTDNWTRDRQRESDRKYREGNRAKIAEKNKRWGKDNLEKLREYARDWRLNHPEQITAKNELRNAIRCGVITRPGECSACGATGVKPDGHHPNYDDPLAVVWLCKKCHRKTRGNNGQN